MARMAKAEQEGRDMRRARLGLILAVWGLVVGIGLGAAAGQEAGAKLSDAERALNVESFEVAWETIRDKHWDPDLAGLDWQAVHDEIRPRVEKAGSKAEYL